jgi:hypothetical protein
VDRYSGKPFLRLLECYVLDAIGQLDDRQRETLQRMEPKLSDAYGMNGTWLDIVNAQMDFPKSLPAQIRKAWEKTLTLARQRGTPIDPNEFAMAFIDQNFPEAVG